VCKPIEVLSQSETQAMQVHDQEDVTGTKPTRLILFSKFYDVNNWKDLFIRVCETLILHSPYVFATLDKDVGFNTEISRNFSYIQSEIKSVPKQLPNGIWIETENSANDLVATCYQLLEKCGFSSNDMQIETTEVHV
jgi:hypothetical protein